MPVLQPMSVHYDGVEAFDGGSHDDGFRAPKSFTSMLMPELGRPPSATFSFSGSVAPEDEIEIVDLPPELQWLCRAQAHPGAVASDEGDDDSIRSSICASPNPNQATGFSPGGSRVMTPESIGEVEPAPAPEPAMPIADRPSKSRRPFLLRSVSRAGGTRARGPTMRPGQTHTPRR